MGIFTYGIKVNKIMKDKAATAFFTPCEIVSAIVNLIDAKRNLSQEEYLFVSIVFETYRRLKNKILLNQEGFLGVCNEIICHLDLIAPYYKFCGNSNIQMAMLIDNCKAEFRSQAKTLLNDNKIFKDEWMILHKEFLQEFYS